MASKRDPLPPFLRLSEASERLARNTGEKVTADWLLQHVSAERLRLYFMVREPIFLQHPRCNEPITYLRGKFVEIGPQWAESMLASPNQPRSIRLQTLLTPYGATWTMDAYSGERKPVEVQECDLFLRSDDVTAYQAPLRLGPDDATAISLGDQKLGFSAIFANYPGTLKSVNWRKAFERRDTNGLEQCLVTPGKKGDRTCWKSKLEKWLIQHGHYPSDHFALTTQGSAQARRPASDVVPRKVEPMKSRTPVKK